VNDLHEEALATADILQIEFSGRRQRADYGFDRPRPDDPAGGVTGAASRARRLRRRAGSIIIIPFLLGAVVEVESEIGQYC
jgi:hypothetical protein